jgi:membrane protein YqaA with SNARE-associated domain
MIDLAAYGGLFLSALIAATILPMQSEAVLVGLMLAGKYSVPALILVAGIGNVLGSILNWLLGRAVETLRNRPWFPVSPERLEQAAGWYRRYGRWSLLLSWMPVIGDPLTVAAGVMKEPFARFLLLVTIAKLGRYIALAAATLYWV